VRPEAAAALLAMHKTKRYDLGHRIWSLVILEVWARIWLDKQDPEQSLPALFMDS
jgi:asparagine synthase (glutamine-hydrolysing)